MAEPTPPFRDAALVLEATGVTKGFTAPDGTRTAILDVAHFALAAGAQVALRGESGSGKTTFLNCLAGILTPDGGEVIVKGELLSEGSEAHRDHVRGRYIGYVFQTFNLLHGLTALENVTVAQMFGAGVDAERAQGLLERVGLQDRLHYRPAQLSVGQQQRVAVARALANRPAVVLADEPTGNLDTARAREAMELIREICRESGAALLVVSHSEEILAGFETVRRLEEVNRAAAVHLEPLGPED